MQVRIEFSDFFLRELALGNVTDKGVKPVAAIAVRAGNGNLDGNFPSTAVERSQFQQPAVPGLSVRDGGQMLQVLQVLLAITRGNNRGVQRLASHICFGPAKKRSEERR